MYDARSLASRALANSPNSMADDQAHIAEVVQNFEASLPHLTMLAIGLCVTQRQLNELGVENAIEQTHFAHIVQQTSNVNFLRYIF